MKWIVSFVTIGLVLLLSWWGIKNIGFLKLAERPQEPRGGELTEFVRVVPPKKQSSEDGILPGPPREALGKVEQFIKAKLKTEARIDYTFTEVLGGEPNKSRITASVSPSPFRWRIDLFIPAKEGESLTTYTNSGPAYSVCHSEEKLCFPFSSFDDQRFSTPIPHAAFLNTVLDLLQLKKFIPGTNEAEQATVEKETRQIASRSAECTKGVDRYGTLVFCTDPETGLLLMVDATTKLTHYTLEAQKVDTSSLSPEAFSSPYPLTER